jgi:hypothetical protein
MGDKVAAVAGTAAGLGMMVCSGCMLYPEWGAPQHTLDSFPTIRIPRLTVTAPPNTKRTVAPTEKCRWPAEPERPGRNEEVQVMAAVIATVEDYKIAEQYRDFPDSMLLNRRERAKLDGGLGAGDEDDLDETHLISPTRQGRYRRKPTSPLASRSDSQGRGIFGKMADPNGVVRKEVSLSYHAPFPPSLGCTVLRLIPAPVPAVRTALNPLRAGSAGLHAPRHLWQVDGAGGGRVVVACSPVPGGGAGRAGGAGAADGRRVPAGGGAAVCRGGLRAGTGARP